MEATKYCRMGDHIAPVSDFGPRPNTKDKLNCSCRPCRRQRYKDRYAKNRVEIEKTKNRDRFQVSAFLAMFKAARIGGQENFEALASAIVGSSDEVFDKLPEGSVEKWLEFRQKGVA